MAASDHLGDQFITVHQLRNMDAGDFVHTKIGDLHRDIPGYAGYDWNGLRKHVDKKDPAITVSFHDDGSPRAVLNGHHRSIDAIDRGRMFIPVNEEDPEFKEY